jgi:hypothetical protein
VSFRAKPRNLLLMIASDETLVSAGSLGHLCFEMPVDTRLCHPVLDTGSSGVRCISTTAAGGSPAASYFFCFAKKSNQKKATPLLRPFGVPKILRQQRAARKLVARCWVVAKGKVLCSPLKQCERTSPVAGAKFWRSNMGNSRARCFEISCCCDVIQITAVIPGFKHAGAGSERSRRICFSPKQAQHYLQHRLKNPGRVRPHEFLGDSP